MKQNYKILVCYNSPFAIFDNYTGKEGEENSGNDTSETGFAKQIKKIRKSLLNYFTEVSTFAVTGDITKAIKRLKKYSPDAVFNFVESIEGKSNYESAFAGIYDLLGFQYTGNSCITLGNCLNKDRAKRILIAEGITTPVSAVIKNGELQNKEFNLNFPVILKLLNEDASIGISEFSVVNNTEDLNKQIEFLYKTYSQDILAEEFINGREINAAVLNGKVLPLSEIVFTGLPDGLPKIVTYEGKWIEESIYYKFTKPQCPAEIDRETAEKIETTAIKAYNALSCRDYARVDIRLSEDNTPYVIEVNPNPDISEDSGFVRAAKAAGFTYESMLAEIAGFAISRKLNDTQN